MFHVGQKVKLRKGAFGVGHPINRYLGQVGTIVAERGQDHIDVRWPDGFQCYGFNHVHLELEVPVAKFQNGDKVVLRSTSEYPDNRSAPLSVRGSEAVFTVVGTRYDDAVDLDVPGKGILRGFTANRFKLAPEGRAMTRETAIEQRDRLVAAGVNKDVLRVRNRSWDTEGIWFGLDVLTAKGGTLVKSLYKPSEVTAYIDAMKPIDAVGTEYLLSLYRFRVPNQSAVEYIPAPDGNDGWTEREIRDMRGVTFYKGKKYRLGRAVAFVPFVS